MFLLLQDILSRYRRLKWTSYGSLTLGWLSSTSTSAGLFYLALPLDVVATTAALTTMGMSAATYFTNRRLKDKASDLASAEEYERTFKRLYARRIAERDEYTISMWTRVADILRHAITAQDIMEMKQLRKSEFTELEHVIEQEIPNLRRAVGPQYNKF